MTKKYFLKLAHINDTHSHFEPNRIQFDIRIEQQNFSIHSHSGGYARISKQINKARKEAEKNHQPFLFLHGGDSFEGTLYFREFKGKANADLLSRLQPDAMVLGNHEIDGGTQPIRDFIDSINFPIMAGNMDLTQEALPKHLQLKGHTNLFDYNPDTQCAKVLIKPFYDRQIAIFGLTLEQMADIAQPSPGSRFLKVVDIAKNTIKQLKLQGIEHIIVLSHLGIDGDRKLAQDVADISLIVGGHSHTLQGDFRDLGLPYIPYAETVNNTPILQSGKYAETFGLANIEFDSKGQVLSIQGNNYFMLDRQFIVQSEHKVTDDIYQKCQQLLNQHSGICWDDEDNSLRQVIDSCYRPAIDAMSAKVLTKLAKPLLHSRLPSKKLPHGSELAPIVSRSMYQQAKLLHPCIDFALHNAGGVRHSLTDETITFADIFGKLLPFEIPLVKYQIHGIFLYQALESAINMATNNSVIGAGTGSFPYPYGLRYSYDGRQPLGQRITKLEVMQQKYWHPVQPNLLYVGVSSAYTTAGKEGYHPLLNSLTRDVIAELTLPSAFANFITHCSDWPQSIAPNVFYTSHFAFNNELSA